MEVQSVCECFTRRAHITYYLKNVFHNDVG